MGLHNIPRSTRNTRSRDSPRIQRARSALTKSQNLFTVRSVCPVTTIRPFNTFGPRQSTRAVIPTIITQALTTNTVKLGSLTPVRDLTFVADTVSGFIRFAESKKTMGRTVNTGSGCGVTIGELANIIIEKVNPKAKIICEQKRVPAGKSEVMQLLCDNRQPKNWQDGDPTYTLEDGLDLTIGWMKEHIASYKTGVYTV